MGIKGPPMMPCITRAKISIGSDVESPQRSEKMPNPAAPVMKTRTGPKRAASQPVRGTMMASATA